MNALAPCRSRLCTTKVEASVRFQTLRLILFESCDEAAHHRIAPLQSCCNRIRQLEIGASLRRTSPAQAMPGRIIDPSRHRQMPGAIQEIIAGDIAGLLLDAGQDILGCAHQGGGIDCG
ncbi:hypothetical protein [Bradyrhizobium sp. BR 10261]|uniref:hypothetical protein n=1 Tax=Bradyrhizobium sp. BR 10261 TaxID=2749992 RepID=UPI001C64CCDF|nr:hypothetical protein [Bradyrhizobium sp. BR 10261]MBW7962936.1 hypothetical protein [Bradyrhizobium sp. BR 10261]